MGSGWQTTASRGQETTSRTASGAMTGSEVGRLGDDQLSRYQKARCMRCQEPGALTMVSSLTARRDRLPLFSIGSPGEAIPGAWCPGEGRRGMPPIWQDRCQRTGVGHYSDAAEIEFECWRSGG